MKKGYPLQFGKQTWKELESIQNKGSSYFFNDWLDIILNSLLALTENINKTNNINDINNISQGKYNDRYMEIIKDYCEGEKGSRPIDHFQRAFTFLIQETIESEKDVLGEIFQAKITYGEHGQFFTPEHVTDLMTTLTGQKVTKSHSESPETMMDPCCGSGRFILSMAKQNPDCYFIGQDIDERCCKMAVINMFIKNLEGEIRLGDSLLNRVDKVWIIKRGGYIFEREGFEIKQPENPKQKIVDGFKKEIILV